MPSVLNLIWLIPALPLLGMLVTGLGGRALTNGGQRLLASYIATACVILSLLISIVVAFNVGDRNGAAYNSTLYTWIPSGDFNVVIGFWVDGLTAVMLLVVTGVASLVHIYAIGYMREDARDPSVEAHHGGHDTHAAAPAHGAADAHAGHDAHDAHAVQGAGESGSVPESGTAPINPADKPGDGGWRVL